MLERSQLEYLVTEVLKPGLLGLAGKRLEKRCAADISGYFRLLGKKVEEAGITKLADTEGIDAGVARNSAEMTVDRVLRTISPLLASVLSLHIYSAMLLADGQTVLREADPPVKAKASELDKVGLSAKDAAEYAAERAAELVKKINATTRTLIADSVADAILERAGVGGLARAIRSIVSTMSGARATMIASTEMNDAMSEASLRKMNRLGIEYKQVILSDEPCPVCEDNAAVGAIPVGDLFPSGDLRTPFHPNCRCATTGARGPDEEE